MALRDGIIFSVWGQSAIPERFTPDMLGDSRKRRFAKRCLLTIVQKWFLVLHICLGLRWTRDQWKLQSQV
jgi:hypothetical protein